MKTAFLLLIACFAEALVLNKSEICAKPNDMAVEKFGIGTGSGGATRFQGRGPAAGGNNAASALKQPQHQQQQQLGNPAAGMLGVINNVNNNQWLQQIGNKKPNKPSTTKAQPAVLVATLYTTITEYSLITSSFTTSIIQVFTKTETERETLTRHSTRTVQITTTRISSTTIVSLTTVPTTLTEYSLVPFTVTERETKTETREKLLISTLTLPQITLTETTIKTTTLPVVTRVFTEYLQALTEATVTSYGTVTVTATSISVLHTAYVTVTTTVDSLETDNALEPIIEYLNGDNATDKIEEPVVTETTAAVAAIFPPLPTRQAFEQPAQYTPNKIVNVPFRGYEIDMIQEQNDYLDEEGSYGYDDDNDEVYDEDDTAYGAENVEIVYDEEGYGDIVYSVDDEEDNDDVVYGPQDAGYVTGDSEYYSAEDSYVEADEGELGDGEVTASDDPVYTYDSYA